VYSAHLGGCERFGRNQSGVCEIYFATNNPGSRLQNDLVLSFGFAFALSASRSVCDQSVAFLRTRPELGANEFVYRAAFHPNVRGWLLLLGPPACVFLLRWRAAR
jgi:hypothetical protein